jgi:hypothetical protein
MIPHVPGLPDISEQQVDSGFGFLGPAQAEYSPRCWLATSRPFGSESGKRARCHGRTPKRSFRFSVRNSSTTLMTTGNRRTTGGP